MADDNSRLVYSTASGRIEETKTPPQRPKGDGIVRIQRQTSGRKGKGVCLITGIDLDDEQLASLAAELKKKCGCGGAVKDGVIEIQGDKRDLLKTLLEAKNYRVKLAGAESAGAMNDRPLRFVVACFFAALSCARGLINLMTDNPANGSTANGA